MTIFESILGLCDRLGPSYFSNFCLLGVLKISKILLLLLASRFAGCSFIMIGDIEQIGGKIIFEVFRFRLVTD